MKIIKLNIARKNNNFGKYESIVDDEDFDLVRQFNWSINTNGYAHRTVGKKRKKLYLHQLIMKIPRGKDVDHRNGNKLDNRRENLRVATRSQNIVNQFKQKMRNGIKTTSIYKGVYWQKNRNKWLVRLGRSKLGYVGYFTDEEKAGRAYDERAMLLFGEFAKLNFLA